MLVRSGAVNDTINSPSPTHTAAPPNALRRAEMTLAAADNVPAEGETTRRCAASAEGVLEHPPTAADIFDESPPHPAMKAEKAMAAVSPIRMRVTPCTDEI